ncbi:unnamed protein product [marine sediment metagenome]|uniref:Uncharacterized protein n=1 Tax=marine sediment metagenome TaxID=412755 RepID=X0ZK70_9ZZZZ
MANTDKVLIFLVIACILGMLTVTAIQHEVLTVENKYLKEQNHMLKTTLEIYEAEINEMSTTIDTLGGEADKASDWNKKMGSLKDDI